MIHLFQVHRRRPTTGLVVCLTIAALFSGKALAQNLISNGDFETGPFDINNTVSSWTVMGTGVVVDTTEGATTPAHSAAFRPSGGIISQAVSTSAGQAYNVDFDASIFGQKMGSVKMRIQALGNNNSSLLDQTINPSTAFQHFQYSFTANGSLTILQFTDTRSGSTSGDNVVDTVSVTAKPTATPTPTPTPTATPTPTPTPTPTATPTPTPTPTATPNPTVTPTPTPTPTPNGPPGQNLVTNGDFEVPPFDLSGNISNWVVSGTGKISELSDEGSTSGTHALALGDGGNFQNDILSQTITTVPGQVYIFEFDAGIFGMPDSTMQLHFQVLGNTSEIDETLPPPVASTENPNQVEFHHYFRTFTADSASTTLRFTDIGTGNSNSDIIIDAVSVVVMPSPTPVPTPTTLPLVNGDFEAWPFNDPGTVAGWTISGNKHVESLTQGATSPSHSAGFSVGGDSTGNILAQTFNTVPNQTYTFDFDAGVYGVPDGSPLQLQAQVVGNNSLFNTTVTPPAALTIHPSLVTFQHYHYMFIADSMTATVQFMDVIGNNSEADVMLDTVSILPVPPTFAQWQNANFTLGQLNDPNISGWSADPDGDGIRNGFEYYFHTTPMNGISTADQHCLPTVGLTSDGTNTYLTFTYHRLLGWSGNPPTVAVSTDLLNWDTSQTQIEQVGIAARDDGFTDVVTVRLKTPINQGPIPQTYFKLMLTQ